MDDQKLLQEMQIAIDLELHETIDGILHDYPQEFIEIFRYQLGWEGDNCGSNAQGKRIRPLLVLLANHACNGDWHHALPAAAAVELVHNFSLIHDDIEDHSHTRRGRETIWVKWGEAQAINAGDAMLTIAQIALMRSSGFLDDGIVTRALNILQNACLKLTRGQYLDIAFEDKDDLPMEYYWQMIEGKTGSLLAACLGLGSLTAKADELTINEMVHFGYKIGAAFQVQDDWLGIWGEDHNVGKSTISDLVTRKKTYPILLGIHAKNEFFTLWNTLSAITPVDAQRLATLLESEGHKDSTKEKFEEIYSDAINSLTELHLDEKQVIPLKQVIRGLFDRLH